MRNSCSRDAFFLHRPALADVSGGRHHSVVLPEPEEGWILRHCNPDRGNDCFILAFDSRIDCRAKTHASTSSILVRYFSCGYLPRFNCTGRIARRSRCVLCNRKAATHPVSVAVLQTAIALQGAGGAFKPECGITSENRRSHHFALFVRLFGDFERNGDIPAVVKCHAEPLRVMNHLQNSTICLR